MGNSLIGLKLRMTNTYMCFSQKDFTFVQHFEFLKIELNGELTGFRIC